MQLRIWDAYLLEGKDMLVIASLAIIWGLGGVLECLKRVLPAKTDNHAKATFFTLKPTLRAS